MNFDAAAAKQAGFSDADIARIQKGITDARAAGVSDEDIQAHLATETPRGDYSPSNLDETDNSWSGFGREALRSAGEGIASIGDIGPQIYTAIKNAPKYASNAGIEAAKSATPEQLKERGIDPAIVNMQPEATTPLPNFYRDIYNDKLPVTPGYENSWTREVGNIVGPTALTLGVDSAPAIIQNVARAAPKVLADTALTTAGTVAGKEGGGAVGGYFGGETGRAWGEGLGSLFGGFTTPILKSTGIGLGRKTWVDPVNSPKRLQQAKDLGVPVDLSLVGNDFAAASGKGSGFNELRRQQQEAIDAAQKQTADTIRGGTADKPITVGDVGVDLRNLSTDAAENARRDADRIYSPMMESHGRANVVDPATLRRKIDEIRADPETSKSQHPTLDYYEDWLNADSTQVIDPVVEGNIQAQRAALEAQGEPLTAQAREARDAQIADLDAQQAANRGPSLGQITTQKAGSERELAKAKGIDARTEAKIHKEGHEKVVEETVGKTGYPPEDFSTVETEYGNLKDDQKALAKLGKKDPAPAYNTVLAAGGEQNFPLLDILKLHADPSELSKIMADNLELNARGPSAAGRPSLPDNIRLPSDGPDWWDAVPEPTKSAYSRVAPTEGDPSKIQRVSDPELRDRIDAGFNLTRADARRGGPQRVDPIEAYPSKSIAAAGLLTGSPGMAAGAVFPQIAGKLTGRIMRSPSITDLLVNGGGAGLTPSDLARAMAAAVGANEQGAH